MTATLILAFLLVATLAGYGVLLGRLSHRLQREQERSADLETDLAENHRRWSLLFSGADWGIALSNDRSNTFSSVNHAFARMHGYSPEELAGTDVLSLFADERRDEAREKVRLAHEEGRSVWDSVHVRKDGGRFPVSISLSVVRNAKGEVVYRIANVQDLTERLRTRSQLEDSERMFEALFRKGPLPTALSTLEGRILDVNDSFCLATGHLRGDVLGRTAIDLGIFHAPMDRARMVEEMRAKGTVAGFAVQLRSKSGETRDFLVSTTSIALQDGPRLLSQLLDITERKRGETALQAAASELRKAQGIAHIGSWVWHVPSSRLEWSDELYSIFGVAREGFDGDQGRVLSELVHPDDRERIERWNQAVLDLVHPPPMEFRIVRRDGSVRSVWGECGEIDYDGEGAPVVVRGIIQDITERKRVEAERRRLESELQTAQKLESIGRLAGGVAHDFNNMLLVIQGHAELAMMHSPPGSPTRPHLETIHLATRKSSDLTRQLLAFARKQSVEARELDPNAAIENLLRMLRRLIGENIRFDWTPQPDAWKIRVDPGQFDQILTNLCVNARDAIAGTGGISIATLNREIHPEDRFSSKGVRPGQYVSISVSDDGSGMDAATLSRIFEPFFTTKEPGTGTGLGLATVYGATRQNNGHLDVRSEPGKGTEFTILFPRDTSPPSAENDTAAGDVPYSGDETLLVVEDESSILAMMCSILELHGYEVLPAKTPSEALAAIETHRGPIHLLVSDVIMPEMNGLELLARSRARRPDLKHLFVSGHSLEDENLPEGIYRGPRYLQKPFSIKELAGKVRKSLDLPEDRS